ncbi:hypothetical protein AYO21_01396 [Fonsecaea monophora]|uniref:Major facilitator superfamily (MFS) profile domain-containing protein n=1 Tax=Fonsecaea monophora TaxID=254056 RepID=A0A177FLD7_9EURO|nr:hypothetical protein AYO21_01396 [Fonsecaea monophora]OAG44400.1 hypothetical protein AYO21_01396 [Fonsecaea monophora]
MSQRVEDQIAGVQDDSYKSPVHQEHGGSSTLIREPLRANYWNLRFIVVFISISFGFNAAMLATSTSWNSLSTGIPETLDSDFVGRRWIFVIANLIAFVGFIAVGRASTQSTIVGLGVLVGIGTGVQIIGPFLALADMVPAHERFTIVGACICLLAPIYAMHSAIAQALLEKAADGWRWTYSINAIFSFAAFLGLLFFYHPLSYRQLHDNPEWEHHKQKDWTGLIALATLLGVLTYFLLWGQTIYAWKSAQMIALVTISGVALTLFLVYGLVGGWIAAAIALVRPKFVKWHLLFGVVFLMVFLSASATLNPTRHRSSLAFLTLIGFGEGYCMLVSYVTGPLAAHKRDMGLVAGLISGFRSLFYGVLGCVFMAIFEPRLQRRMVTNVTEVVLADGLPQTSLVPLFSAIQAALTSGDSSGLLKVSGVTLPMVADVFGGVARAAANAWRFIFELGNIYFILVIILALLSADTDKLLSKKDRGSS